MDWSENCIKCDRSGNLLVCNENGCPLALHERCLGFPAGLDDEGRFYCPYCLYKQAIAELRRARECASEKKKALLIFMDGKSIRCEEDMGVVKTCEDNGHIQSKTSDTDVHITSRDDGKSKANNNGTIDLLGGEDSASSEAQDASFEMNGENGNRTAEERAREEEHGTCGEERIQEEECETLREEQILENEHETSGGKQIEEEDLETFVKEQIEKEAHETFAEEQIQEEERETSVEEDEKIRGEELETSSASIEQQEPSRTMTPRAKRLSNRRKPVDTDSEAVPMQSEPLQNDDKKQASPSMTPTRRSARRSLPDSKMGKAVKKELCSPNSPERKRLMYRGPRKKKNKRSGKEWKNSQRQV